MLGAPSSAGGFSKLPAACGCAAPALCYALRGRKILSAIEPSFAESGSSHIGVVWSLVLFVAEAPLPLSGSCAWRATRRAIRHASLSLRSAHRCSLRSLIFLGYRFEPRRGWPFMKNGFLAPSPQTPFFMKTFQPYTESVLAEDILRGRMPPAPPSPSARPSFLSHQRNDQRRWCFS